MQHLILASGSKYRQQRLVDAGITFKAIPADIDESPAKSEHPRKLAERLAIGKAQVIAEQYPNDIIIGSDQVAAVPNASETVLLGKSGSFERAKQQLSLCSGKTVHFYTSLCIMDGKQDRLVTHVEQIDVAFKALSESIIEKYLAIDEPFDCAGSFKMEKAGIFLFDKITCRDPNALVGLPMILLNELFEELGLSIFDFVGQA